MTGALRLEHCDESARQAMTMCNCYF